MTDPLSDVPGLDKIKPKYVVAGVVVAGAVGVIVFIRARRAAATAAATAPNAATAAQAGLVTDPDGNTCTALDPGSGYCPGTSGDQAYYAEQSDSLGEEASGADDGAGGIGNTTTGDFDAAGYPLGSAADLAWQAAQSGASATGTTTASSTGPTTNSQWVTDAIGELPGDTGTLQTALSSVLGGLAVTTAQQQLFMEAVGLLGPPPGGYPTPIKLTDSAGQPASTAGQVKVPATTGMQAGPAHNAIVAAGLKPIADTGQKADEIVTSTNPKAGTMVASGSAVDIVASPPPAPPKPAGKKT
jgi:PASTA domain